LLEKFRGEARTAFLFQTQCDSREFMRFLLAELGCETYEQDFVRMHDEFNKFLLQEARAGRRFIIVIDEAQNLDSSVLETIRLLSDFETPKAKLLQIILVGQPELADKLASRKLLQLRQRISVLSGLSPLSIEETRAYIDHRLRIAGYSGDPLFTPEAMQVVAQFTEGIPRNINNFCFSALSLGCALGQKLIGNSVVEEVIADMDITRHVTTLPSTDYGVPEGGSNYGFRPGRTVPIAPAAEPRTTLAPAEAKSYMQQLAVQLRDWKRGGNGTEL